jgi:HSP20 family protein
MSTDLAKRKNGESSPARIPSLFSDFFNSERLFDFGLPSMNASSSLPAVNVKETANEFIIDVAAPGLKRDDFNISIENDALIISAEKEKSSEEKEENYTRKEYSYNSFSRAFSLPNYVKGDDIKAKYSDGVLKLTIPKTEDAKKKASKKIKID